MSFQAMTWAVDQDLKTNEKMALVMLANCCNHHTGQCNPSHKRLAKECGMSVSTLKRCIEKLEEGGFLKIEHREQEGVSLPNQYHLNIGYTPMPVVSEPDSDLEGSGQSELGSGQYDPTVGSERTDGSVQSDLGVGSERATKQEYNQEGKQEENQEYNHNGNDGSSVPAVLPKPKRKKQDDNDDLGAPPEWLPLDAWVAFVDMRKAMGSRGKLTMNAAQLIIKKLEELKNQGHDPRLVLEQSVINNWRGVFPVKQQLSGRQQALEDRNRQAVQDFANGGNW